MKAGFESVQGTRRTGSLGEQMSQQKRKVQ